MYFIKRGGIKVSSIQDQSKSEMWSNYFAG